MQQRLWWRLPGPSRFVAQLVADVQAGRSVVVSLPLHAPPGLSAAVRAHLEQDESAAWQTFAARDEPEDPAHALFARFVGPARADAIRTPAALATHDALAGAVVWVDGVGAGAWSAWREFLADYERAARARPLVHRAVFVVPVPAAAAAELPADAPCLVARPWRAAVEPLDTLVFAAELFRERKLPDLEKRVATAVTAAVALWDPAVAQRLASERIERVLDPRPVLLEIARERGWSVPGDPPSWAHGSLDWFDGEAQVHSAACALDDVRDEVPRRVWSAEVGVMLPFVEQRRREILERLAGVLRVPYTTRTGEVISDLHDLEVGHIEYQLLVSGQRPDVRRVVAQLREIRNSLSHLETLRPEQLAELEAGLEAPRAPPPRGPTK